MSSCHGGCDVAATSRLRAGRLACALSLLLAACSEGDGPEAPAPVTWHAVAADDTAGALYAIWAGGPADVWIAGGEGNRPLLRHFDGKTWTRHDPPLQAKLRWVHGDGKGGLLVVGDGGAAARYDGTAWQALPTGHDGATLWGAWLEPDGRAWAVGGGPGGGAGSKDDVLLLLHWPAGAAAWQPQALPARTDWPTSAESQLFKIWRDAATGVMFAVGGRALVATSADGLAWTSTLADGSGAPLFTVHGRSATDVWAIGGLAGVLLLRYDGAAWSAVDTLPDAPHVAQGVFVHPDGTVDVAGGAGYTARRHPDGAWVAAPIDTNADLHATASDGARTWVVGGDIAVDKAEHHGVVYCDDPAVPAIVP